MKQSVTSGDGYIFFFNVILRTEEQCFAWQILRVCSNPMAIRPRPAIVRGFSCSDIHQADREVALEHPIQGANV